MNTTFSVFTEIVGDAYPQSALGHVFYREIACSLDLRVQHMCHGDVVIIGDAFPIEVARSGPASPDAGRSPLDFLIAFAGTCWGRYVGIARDRETGEVAIYRDPSGMVPCYYGRADDHLSIGTDATSICRHLGIRPAIDWASIANHLLAPDRRRRETCLHGIAEVLPGELVRVTRDAARHELFWRSANYAGRNMRIGFGDAAALLERTLADIMAVWCERYPRPQVALSGGFDSSSIAALASRSGPIGLLVYFAQSPQADERRYAGEMARHLGLELSEMFCDPGLVQVRRNLSAARPLPSARAFTQVFDRHADERGKALGAAAHFNGGGGDNVFGKLHSAYPLADRYLHAGWTRYLPGTAVDICRATGASLPAVLRQAVGAWSGRARGATWPITTDLLSRTAIDMRDDSLHPWVDTQHSLCPGQSQLARNVARATAATDHLHIEGALPTIYPLLSQPLVEVCLSFPTWFWFEGGRDRALARAAMTAYLPDGILDRRQKGAFDGLVYRIIDLNRAAILADLTDGVLASKGLIDVAAVIALLSERNRHDVGAIRTLHLHEIEIWCRHWC